MVMTAFLVNSTPFTVLRGWVENEAEWVKTKIEALTPDVDLLGGGGTEADPIPTKKQ